MADIKTRESLHTAKTFDRVQRLAEKTREGANEAKQGINDAFASGESSESEYAGNHLAAYESGAARITIRSVDKIGRWGVRQTVANIRKLRSRPPKTDVTKFKRLTAPERMSLQSGKTVKKARNAVKTAKSAEKSVKTGIKASKATAKSLKSTVKATVRAVKAVAKAIVFAVKATAAAVKGIVAAIAAGGGIAVVVVCVIVIIAGIIVAVCGVFTPDNTGNYSVVYMMSACDSESDAKVAEIINNNPHDYLVMKGRKASKKDVISVFAVLSNSSQKDFSEPNDKLLAKFRAVFNTMNTIDYYTSTTVETVIREYTDEDGGLYQVEETVIKTVLHIEYVSMSASEGAQIYNFNQKQREQLNTFLSSDFDELWEALVE